MPQLTTLEGLELKAADGKLTPLAWAGIAAAAVGLYLVLKKNKVGGLGDSDESRELELWIVNEGALYRSMVQPIIKMLKRRKKNGTYDHKKALKAWENLANEGSKRYHKENGSKNDKWFEIFTQDIRIISYQ